jgi:hypothetical protein
MAFGFSLSLGSLAGHGFSKSGKVAETRLILALPNNGLRVVANFCALVNVYNGIIVLGYIAANTIQLRKNQ